MKSNPPLSPKRVFDIGVRQSKIFFAMGYDESPSELCEKAWEDVLVEYPPSSEGKKSAILEYKDDFISGFYVGMLQKEDPKKVEEWMNLDKKQLKKAYNFYLKSDVPPGLLKAMEAKDLIKTAEKIEQIDKLTEPEKKKEEMPDVVNIAKVEAISKATNPSQASEPWKITICPKCGSGQIAGNTKDNKTVLVCLECGWKRKFINQEIQTYQTYQKFLNPSQDAIGVENLSDVPSYTIVSYKKDDKVDKIKATFLVVHPTVTLNKNVLSGGEIDFSETIPLDLNNCYVVHGIYNVIASGENLKKLHKLAEHLYDNNIALITKEFEDFPDNIGALLAYIDKNKKTFTVQFRVISKPSESSCSEVVNYIPSETKVSNTEKSYKNPPVTWQHTDGKITINLGKSQITIDEDDVTEFTKITDINLEEKTGNIDKNVVKYFLLKKARDVTTDKGKYYEFLKTVAKSDYSKFEQEGVPISLSIPNPESCGCNPEDYSNLKMTKTHMPDELSAKEGAREARAVGLRAKASYEDNEWYLYIEDKDV